MVRDRILVDLNSVAHAAHQGTVLKAGDQETQAIFGTIRTLRILRARHPTASMIGLWDGLSWRKAKDPEYKANRQDDEKKRADRARYTAQMPYLRKALHYLGITQVAASNLEADDLAAILSKRYAEQGLVRLVTGDQDWLQLVGPSVIWEDHRNDARRVNAKSFQNYTGYPTIMQFVQSKALQGDTSDNLKGVGMIGEERAADLLKVWGRVEAFLADPDPKATWASKPIMVTKEKDGVATTKPKTYPKALADFHQNVDARQEKFFHNMTMMNLTGDLPAPERLTLKKGEYSEDRFRILCHELGFSSIYRDGAFETFTAPFKGTLQ